MSPAEDPTPLVLRNATLADAESLAALAEQTFREAFGDDNSPDDNSPDDMDSYVRDSFSLERVRGELADDANTFLLAFIDGSEQPTGYAKLRAGPIDPSVSGPAPIELERLYVLRSAMGRESGRRSCARFSTRREPRATEPCGSASGRRTRAPSRSMSAGDSNRSAITCSSWGRTHRGT